jgi:hypothetical protein
MNSILIDICVVTKMNNGIRIRSEKMESKFNKRFDCKELERISTGTRQSDGKLLRLLSDGELSYDDLIKTYLHKNC